MTGCKSIIYLLIFLLIFQSGCSYQGYMYGQVLDEKHPKRVKYEKIEEMRRGDIVEVIMFDDTVHLGLLAHYDKERFIGLAELDAEITQNTYNDMQVYEWNNIKTVRKMEERQTWRPVFTLIGLAFDIVIIGGLYVIKAWAEGMKGMSNLS